MPRPEPQRRFLSAYHAHLIHERHVTGKTAWQYRRELELAWDHAGVRDPARFTPRHLTAYVDRGIPAGVGRRNGGNEQLASSTRATYGNHILSAYRWAAAAGIIPRNPLGTVASFKDDPGPPRSLPLAQVMRLIAHVAGDLRLLIMVWLAYGVGLRACEIAALRVGDLVLADRPHLWVVDGKGERTDVVPLNLFVAELLAGAVAGRPASAPVISSHTRPGRPLTDKTVSKLLSRAMRAAGIPGTGHALRHTFATQLLAKGKGKNLRAVSNLLRHRDLNSIKRYVDGYNQDAIDTIDLLPVTPPAPAARRRRDRHIPPVYRHPYAQEGTA